MAGLIDLVTSGETGKDSTVRYVHLGGQPALSAYGVLSPKSASITATPPRPVGPRRSAA